MPIVHELTSVINNQNGSDHTPSNHANVPAVERAVRYGKLGLKVIPLHEPLFDDTENCVGCTCEEYKRSEDYRQWLIKRGREREFKPDYKCPDQSRGKHPRISQWEKKATSDEATIRAWWKKWPNAGIGHNPGRAEFGPEKRPLLVVDDDKYKDTYAGTNLPLPQNTPTAITGSLGAHDYFYMPLDKTYGQETGDLPYGIDIRGVDNMAVLPETLHYSGRTYEWELDLSLEDVEPQELPQHIIDLIESHNGPPGSEIGPSDIEAVRRSSELVEKVLHHADMPVVAQPWGNGRKWIPYDCPFNPPDDPHGEDRAPYIIVYQDGKIGAGCHHERCRKRIHNSGLSGWALLKQLKGYIDNLGNGAFFTKPHNTDMGNAQRMYAYVKDRVMYVSHFAKWYTWSGTHWQEDNNFTVLALAKQTVLNMYGELKTIGDDDKRKEQLKWTLQSESRSRLESMIALLRSEPGISVGPEILDREDMRLSCQNGTIDLTTGLLGPSDPAHKSTMCLDVEYNPHALCPLWESFLNRIMGSNPELVSFIQRLVGHALTGDAAGKYLVFMWGEKGNNGKSTLVETIMRLLGPYALKSPTEMVMAKAYRSGVPNDIARLRGVRFTVTNEVDEGMTLSESVIKDLTGNDTLVARFMREEFFDFPPTHKLWIYGNHKPEIRGTDAAIWDRVKLIPFEVEIPEKERDLHLQEKLAAELPGILAWAVRGCLEWQKIGISAPETVKLATGKYKAEQDIIGQFLEDCCDVGKDYQVEASHIFHAYLAWCRDTGNRSETNHKFGTELSRRNHTKGRTTTGQRSRLGLQLNNYGRRLVGEFELKLQAR